MKLKERLPSLPENLFIYLGTYKGSAWLWIAQRAQMEADLDKINASLLENLIKDINNNQDEANRLERQIDKIQGKLTDSKTQKTIANLQADLHCAQKEFKRIQDRLNYLEGYHSKWIDIQDREVICEDPHTVQPVGLGLQIEGDEMGKYWFLSEIQQAMNKKTEKVKQTHLNVQEVKRMMEKIS